MVLFDAIKRANSTEGAKIRDAIAQTKDFAGVTGKITLDADRNAVKPAVVLEVKGREARLSWKRSIRIVSDTLGRCEEDSRSMSSGASQPDRVPDICHARTSAFPCGRLREP